MALGSHSRRARRARTAKKPSDATPCGYCFSRWATVFDHLRPAAHGGTNSARNLYPSCARCNAILSDLVFDTIEAKRDYVRLRLIEKGQWHKENFISAAKHAPEMLNVNCHRCSKVFTPKRWWQKYCSHSCRSAAWFDRNFQRRRSLADFSSKPDPEPDSSVAPSNDRNFTDSRE